jgi:hypothetical protein
MLQYQHSYETPIWQSIAGAIGFDGAKRSR